jgi:hypothetical protein
MAPKNGQPPDSRGAGARAPRKPLPSVHAHDEFELDIDVDSDLTAVASARPATAGLFDEDEEEPTMEISAAVLQEATAAASELGLDLPARSDEEVLPLFMPAQPTTPNPVPRPPRTRPAPPRQAPKPGPPDLSLPFDVAPLVTDLDVGPKETDDLFADVSDVSGDPPIHDLSLPPARRSDHGLDLLPPPKSESGDGSQPRFARGLTGGMRPLDDAQFALPEPTTPKKKARTDAPLRGLRAPMAGSKRIVRRAFQFGLRDLLLLVLIVMIGVGLWVGWTIYQDYRKNADWQRFDQSRAQLERSKTEAIDRIKPKKPKDVP